MPRSRAAATVFEAFEALCEKHDENTFKELITEKKEGNKSITAMIDVLSGTEIEMLLEKIRLYVRDLATDVRIAESTLVELTRILRHILELHNGKDSQILQCVVPFHDLLLQWGIERQAYQLQDEIAKLCEYFWEKETPGAEFLITQLVPYLLINSLSGSAPSQMLKRLFNVRQGLLLLDFADESIGLLKELLLRAFLEPAILKSPVGIKFLAFTFSLDAEFVDDIHRVIRAQLSSSCRETLARAYGLTYFQAWAAADSTTKAKIEGTCIQDLIYCAIHSSSLAFNAFRFALKVSHVAQ